MSQEADFSETIERISRELVSQFATDEIELFDELYAQFQKDPARFKQSASSNDPLEFGFDELLTTYTPIIISIVTVTLDKLSEIVMRALQGETEALIQEKTKEVFQRVLHGEMADPYKSEFLTFSAKELDALYQLGVQEGISYGLSAKDAAKVMTRLTQPILRIRQN